MKSRSRPPLTLSDPDPVDTPDAMATPEATAAPEPAPQPEVAPERPMSERRRRRLLEQQRTAELEMPSPTERQPAPPVAADLTEEAPLETVAFATSADAPPATYSPPPAPAALASAPVQSGRTYLIAGVAAALWVGGVASWAA